MTTHTHPAPGAAGNPLRGLSLTGAVVAALKAAAEPQRVADVIKWLDREGWIWGADLPRSAVAKALDRRANGAGDIARAGPGLWVFKADDGAEDGDGQ